jgi:ABC-2 type transport system permease protein
MELDPTLTGMIFNPATVVSFVGFLVLGYLFYSTFYAAIGAIANSEKEARPLLMPIIFVLFIPAMMIAISFVPDNPNADWIRVVSYIPTFTPLVMMMRVAVLAPTLEGNPLASGLMLEAGLI